MKVLVIGGGGREHALVWKIAQSPMVSKIYCAPGNSGIGEIAECIPIKAEDIFGSADFAEERKIGLTVVGPEVPLVLGIVDLFEQRGLKIVGPTKKAAEIEGSKVFAKNLMEDLGIPTARYKVANSPVEARNFIRIPCCIKTDGLAAGKGVVPCFNEKEAIVAIDKIMVKRDFGAAGDRIVMEEFLEGEEATFKVFTDGRNIIPMLPTQDHKPVFDGDKGLNTGGMGAYAPAPIITKELAKEIIDKIIKPFLTGMRKQGRIYKGVLYVGLMITSQGPKVLEFNCRFGDPELQPLVLLMKNDIVPILEAISEERLSEVKIEWKKGAAVCVTMASKGYPGKYEKGKEIEGLEEIEKMEDVRVFHAGTVKENGKWKTAGGRVLGVTAYHKNIVSARNLAYAAVAKIKWQGVHYRTDISNKALKWG